MATLQWASVMDRTAILPCEAHSRAPAMHCFLLPPPSSLRGQRYIRTQVRTAILPCEARPRAPATHCFPLPLPSSLEKGSVLPSGIARRFCRARRAHARQPCTAFSSLLPILYEDSDIFTYKDARRFCRAYLCAIPLCPLPARRPSRLTEAHCKVATHCFLLPPPYSLLFPCLTGRFSDLVPALLRRWRYCSSSG